MENRYDCGIKRRDEGIIQYWSFLLPEESQEFDELKLIDIMRIGAVFDSNNRENLPVESGVHMRISFMLNSAFQRAVESNELLVAEGFGGHA